MRVLLRAISLGCGSGLVLGAAYLAMAPASPAPAPSRQASVAALVEAPHLAKVAMSAEPPPSSPVQTPSIRSRFQLALPDLKAMAPFRFARVAAADSDQTCLAEAVYFEARGEPEAGQRAVAQVVLNRVRHPAFPKTVCGVVHQRVAAGCQFAFACGDRQPELASAAWRRSRMIAFAALHGAVMSEVGDATHFQSVRGGAFAGLLKVADIGEHAFYRFAGARGSSAMFHQTPSPSPGLDAAPVHLAVLTPPHSGRIEVVYAAPIPTDVVHLAAPPAASAVPQKDRIPGAAVPVRPTAAGATASQTASPPPAGPASAQAS